LKNLGIGRMLEDSKDNEELARYLAEKSYESASLGETSADELAVVSPSAGSSGDLEIYRQSAMSERYEEAKTLSANIEDYEKHIVEKHTQLDLYRAKNKTRGKISFNDLTLQENLNYIKYTLKNTNEAFAHFDITKDKFQDFPPEIPAAIIQKMATRLNINIRKRHEVD
jgi:hypothetical protein